VIESKIIDDLLPQRYADDLEADIMYLQFPWHYIKDVTYKNYGTNSGFVNVVYDMGGESNDWLPFVKPLVYNIESASGYKMEKLLRIRIGLLLPGSTDKPYNTPHVDFLMSHRTACYYVNDSDGDTVTFDQDIGMIGTDINNDSLESFTQSTDFTVAGRCSPKKNRLYIFDGRRFHASTRPKDHDRRVVITVNYI
jgi:hypothetical protein